MRILLVDDSADFRRAMGRLLRRHHVVVDVESPALALARIATDEPFDAMVCDYHMPQMNGAELHARVRLCAPRLARATVFVTAAAERDSVRLAIGSSAPLLTKPIPIEILCGTLDQLVRTSTSHASLPRAAAHPYAD